MTDSRNSSAVRLRRWSIAAAGMAAIGVVSRTGAAEELPGVVVRWAAPATCPSGDALRARVRRLLPPATGSASSAGRWVAEGTVESVNGQYRLRLSVARDGEATRVTRVFASDSCESLTGAAAVTLALLIRGAPADPHADTPAAGPSSGAAAPATSPTSSAATTPGGARTATKPVDSPPSPPAPAPPAPPRAADAAPSANPPAATRWSPTLEGPLVAMDQGMLPSWAYGVGVGFGLHASRVRVMLTGVLWLPQDGSTGTLYGGRYERRSGELSVCYGWPVGSFDFGPCAMLTLEDVTADGSGPGVLSQAGHATWVTAGVAARATWSVRRWVALFVRPSLALTTSRPTFAIDGVGPLYQVPLVSGGVDLGCEWIL